MVGGFTVIIMQVSVQIGLNLTGLELRLAKFHFSHLVQDSTSSKQTYFINIYNKGWVKLMKKKILRIIWDSSLNTQYFTNSRFHT